MTKTKNKPLISASRKAKAKNYVRDEHPRGALKTGSSTKMLFEAVVDVISYNLFEDDSATKLDIERDFTVRIATPTGSQIKALVVFDGKKTFLIPVAVTQSLVKIAGDVLYTSHGEAAPMLLDLIVENVEAVLEGATEYVE